ncbi:MAG: hypothetical protein QF412_14640 [Planctomycetota bacterium]|nr:hypothetical protein [Planctomycetota bacterium]
MRMILSPVSMLGTSSRASLEIPWPSGKVLGGCEGVAGGLHRVSRGQIPHINRIPG